MCLSLDQPLNIIGTEAEASPGEFHLLQLTTSSHRVNGLNLEAEHHCDVLCREQAIFFRLFHHGATIKQCLLFCRVN